MGARPSWQLRIARSPCGFLLNSRDQSNLAGPTVDGDLPGVADLVRCPGDAYGIGHARHRSIVGSAKLTLIVQRPGAVCLHAALVV
jgi:hypothetical protein